MPRASVEEVAAWSNQLSDLYTIERGVLGRRQGDREHLAAKVLSFLASDAPKLASALGECARREPAFGEATTVVDLGCGVGATSVGYLQWLVGHGRLRRPRRFIGIDAVPATLAVWAAVVGKAAALAGVEATVESRRGELLDAEPPTGSLVLCQTALNERLAGNRGGELAHDERTVAAVARWAGRGPVLLVEPALKGPTRALHRMRDAILARGGARVVAPCPHQAACPMLGNDRDWCHESPRIEPTPMVAAVQAIARRRDERALHAFLGLAPASATAEPRLWRLVSDALGSRGKTERWACCDDGRLRLLRVLDKERSERNALLVEAERGTLVARPRPADGSGGDVADRIGPDVAIEAWPPLAAH